MLAAVPLLLYTGLIWLVPRIDASRATRQVVIVAGAVVTVAAIGLITLWARNDRT
jgi:hypothetical protein